VSWQETLDNFKNAITFTSTVFVPYQTDVIVNTTGEELCLSRGAVSTAILNRAGKEMQAEINKKRSKQALPHDTDKAICSFM